MLLAFFCISVSANHKTVEIVSCLGLSFYILFVVMSALTIFWTNQWKKARAIKYTTVVLAILAGQFIIIILKYTHTKIQMILGKT